METTRMQQPTAPASVADRAALTNDASLGHDDQPPPFYEPAKSVVVLRVLEGDLKDHLFVLKTGLNVLGRDLACDHHVLHATVSRRHCTMELTPQGLKAWDMQSLHGVVVNGNLTTEAPLHFRDVVQLGDVVLSVECRMLQAARPLCKVERREPKTERLLSMASKATTLVSNAAATSPAPYRAEPIDADRALSPGPDRVAPSAAGTEAN